MVRMRYVFYAIILTIILLILALGTACVQQPSFNKFPASSPYEALRQDDIDYLDVNFSLLDYVDVDSNPTWTDEDIADAIVTWQNDYMTMEAMALPDVSYAMRWNNIMPGIYPVDDMIKSRQLDEGIDTKIYGVCWDHAAVFAAIARHFGLEVRVTAYKIYISDSTAPGDGIDEGPERGMGPQESSAMRSRLSLLGFSIPEESLRNAMVETYAHYRPEVLIGSDWVGFDATNPTGEYTLDSNYEEAPWDEGLDGSICVRL